MTAYFCFIVQSAQRHAHVFALHGIGDALAETGLTNSRRTVEAEYRTLLSAVQCSYCQIFQDALLHLLHAVVVTVQDSLGARQAQVVLGIFIPRKVYHGL